MAKDFDPVGCEDIADRLGVPHQTVKTWKLRGHMPDPEASVSGRPCWNWPTIERWARENNRPRRA